MHGQIRQFVLTPLLEQASSNNPGADNDHTLFRVVRKALDDIPADADVSLTHRGTYCVLKGALCVSSPT